MTIEIANSEQSVAELQKESQHDIPNDDGTASGMFDSTKKRVIPLGNRLLVKRRKAGNKLGSGLLVASEEFAGQATDIADVVYAPERTMADTTLLENAETIVSTMMEEVKDGSSDALNSLRSFSNFLYDMSIQAGDIVLVSKYRGTDFTTTETKGETLSVINMDDVVAVIKDNV